MKTTVIAALIGLLAATVLVAGCGPFAQTREVSLSESDDGSQVELKKGDTLVVTLEGNPTTGYLWEVEEPGSITGVLQQAGESEFKASSDALGAGGTETLRFKATDAGQATLKLVYHRPWETGVEPLETFQVQVTVR